MEVSKKLIKNTKKKFIIFSIMGITIVLGVSYFALKFHNKIVVNQASIQTTYQKISKQIELVNKISRLSSKFYNNPTNEEIDLENEFKSLLSELNQENEKFNKWLSENNFSTVKNIEELLDKGEIDNKMLLFLKRARELIQNDNLTRLETKQHIRFLSEHSRDGLVEVFSFINKKLANEQEKSLTQLRNMGFILVALCILQVLLVWLLVFRPLYTTILLQHQKISNAILSAESASRSKTDFLANISHEIRTPMTAIMGYSEILTKTQTSSEDKQNAINIIDQNASHLLGLIDEILDISKIEAGKFDFDKEEVDLSLLLNEVYSLINVKAQEKNIQLIFKNQGEIPQSIISDSKRLKQILFNILGNAIKFTEKGYVELIVKYLADINKVSVLVKDTGTGISKEQQRNLFKPFEQADTSVARRFGGTGLGLVLSRGLAKGMGGDVFIKDSIPGVGTTFEILIDVGDIPHIKLLPKLSTSILDHKSEKIEQSLCDTKILVVDDAKENARLFKIYLAEAGANVEVAYDGQSAINIAKENFFDIILLDLQMPGKDGFQVIKELRNNKFTKPIVALTAHAMKEEKQKTKEAGFDNHITKPVRPNELISTILTLIKDQTIRTT